MPWGHQQNILLFGRHCMTVLEVVSGFAQEVWTWSLQRHTAGRSLGKITNGPNGCSPRWRRGVGVTKLKRLLGPPLTNQPIEVEKSRKAAQSQRTSALNTLRFCDLGHGGRRDASLPEVSREPSPGPQRVVGTRDQCGNLQDMPLVWVSRRFGGYLRKKLLSKFICETRGQDNYTVGSTTQT